MNTFSEQQKKNTSGFTLIEALVAIFIFSLALVSLITIMSRGITGVAQARDQAIAQFLAQEGIEMVRNVRDTNLLAILNNQGNTWDQGLDPLCNAIQGNACFIKFTGNDYVLGGASTSNVGFTIQSDNQIEFYEAANANNSKFTREIYVEPAFNGAELIVHSIVSWNNGVIPRQVELITSITNWIPTQP